MQLTDVRASYVLKMLVLILVLSAAGTLGGHAFGKEITFLTISYPANYMTYLQDTIIPQFEAEYGVKVNLQSASWGERKDKLLMLIAAGTPPDIVRTGFYSPYEEGSQGILAPLDRYLDEWPNKDKYPPALWEGLKWRGQVMVVPQAIDFRTIVYNKQMFAENGLDPEAPPKGWEQMIQYGRRLTHLDDRGTVTSRGIYLGRSGSSTAQDFCWFMETTGVSSVDAVNFKSNLNTPEALEALRALVEMQEAGHGASPALSGVTFVNGGVGMRRSGPFVISELQTRNPDMIDNVGVFAPQQTPTSTPVAHGYFDGLGITADSQNKDLAWAFLKLLLSDDVVFETQRMTGWTTGRVDQLQRIMSYQPKLDQWYALFGYLKPAMIPVPRNDSQGQLSSVITKVYSGQMAPQVALETAHEQWQRLMDEWKETAF